MFLQFGCMEGTTPIGYQSPHLYGGSGRFPQLIHITEMVLRQRALAFNLFLNTKMAIWMAHAKSALVFALFFQVHDTWENPYGICPSSFIVWNFVLFGTVYLTANMWFVTGIYNIWPYIFKLKSSPWCVYRNWKSLHDCGINWPKSNFCPPTKLHEFDCTDLMGV